MFNLFFGTKGRLKRLQYSLFNLCQLVFFLPFIMAINGSKGDFSVTPSTPAGYAVAGLGMWVFYCLSVKRSRDFSGSIVRGQVYVACVLIPTTLLIIPGYKEIALVLVAISALPMLFLGYKLGYSPSLEDETVVGANTESSPKPVVIHQENLGEAALLPETDLVARAAQLRTAEEAQLVSAQPQASPARRPANAGFGRRNTAPAFGNR